MNGQSEQKTRADIYREHVLKAANYLGTKKKYCEENGLDVSQFYSYQSEMGLTKKPLEKKVFTKIVATPDIIPKKPEIRQTKYPDPKWLAEFLRYYSGNQ